MSEASTAFGVSNGSEAGIEFWASSWLEVWPGIAALLAQPVAFEALRAGLNVFAALIHGDSEPMPHCRVQ